MPLTLKISQGTIDIPIEKYKGIALAVSGGIDSATLLYIMSEYIHENNLNTQIYALTVPNKTDSASGYHAQLVIEFVKRKFPVYINHTIKSTIFDGGNKNAVIEKWVKELLLADKIQCEMNGVTANPKDPSFKFVQPKNPYVKPLIAREGKPKKYKRIGELDLHFPFANIDKQGISEITELKNITTKLLLITKSCTSPVYYHCGECWWCQERTWGFDIKYQQIQNRQEKTLPKTTQQKLHEKKMKLTKPTKDNILKI